MSRLSDAVGSRPSSSLEDQRSSRCRAITFLLLRSGAGGEWRRVECPKGGDHSRYAETLPDLLPVPSVLTTSQQTREDPGKYRFLLFARWHLYRLHILHPSAPIAISRHAVSHPCHAASEAYVPSSLVLSKIAAVATNVNSRSTNRLIRVHTTGRFRCKTRPNFDCASLDDLTG